MYAHFKNTITDRLAVTKIAFGGGVYSGEDALLSGLVFQGPEPS